jgi:hypothetical protein
MLGELLDDWSVGVMLTWADRELWAWENAERAYYRPDAVIKLFKL